MRYLDSDIGRFTGVDPLADAPLNVGTSPYTYVWNNPLKFIDPDGRHGESVDDHMKVNLQGVVTEVIAMDGPNRFFDDQTGTEIAYNDAENNPNEAALLSQKFNVGDKLYQNISNSDILGFIVNAGTEPGRIRSKGICFKILLKNYTT